MSLEVIRLVSRPAVWEVHNFDYLPIGWDLRISGSLGASFVHLGTGILL